ncbi:type II CRISPR-associated endonuclease Cas1 [Helicobacter sp. 11S02629-2]|uniref:type II CRISPR-associated endonuclease Cas1 n=1 Tax=Helicobacter sp. 11S02629-2 TaxID=1476195 RepID=UPI000BCE5A9A|nr:type II CRISPR-associated endonuclease Cas1 [Helicobacter sp. 11S02629-2]PAF41742.1 hypothetical protein BKH40_08330 [Helicobacter sp. 11S02629-2]
MANLNVYIDTNTTLSIKHGNLILDDISKLKESVSLPLELLSSVVIDSYSSVVTKQVLVSLAENNVLLVLCDNAHLPTSILLPFQTHSTASLHIRKQIKVRQKKLGLLWQEIIKAKIINSANHLRFKDKARYKILETLASKVLPDDKGNKEAIAAKEYFKALFGAKFNRQDDNATNIMLNYTYALLRAKCARVCAAKGLLPSLGIHHTSFLNSFNLADDFLEPFRAFVDVYVTSYLEACKGLDSKGSQEFILSPSDKKHLLRIFDHKVYMDGKYYLIDAAIEQSIGSYLQVILEKREHLSLPVLDERYVKSVVSNNG